MEDSDTVADSSSVPTAPTNGEIVQKQRTDYNRLVRQARLLSILLEKLEFKILPESLGVSRSLLSRDLTAKSQVMASGHEDGTCVANIVWDVHLKFKKRNVVKCSASYIITYEGMKDCPEEAIKTFVETVGKTATYAYFRALYSHLDWSANLNSPPLPILQFQPKL